MPLNPIETLNVFKADLREELRNRSKAPNLVKTRAPFIRFTTGAAMGRISTTLNQIATNNPSIGLSYDTAKLASEYNGCSFFTLGLHGWSDLDYSAEDIYGTKGDKGLVVGVTYTGNGTKKLVYTYGGTGSTTDFRKDAIVITGNTSARNYPPPGITSAKVERLRNGNVLRFTVETQCYTQEQLQMLDILCFVPGMTCILEWGTSETTPTGKTQSLSKILNFADVERTKEFIDQAATIPRETFIDLWCKPNKFNYDWVVANIANVKTTLENNIYKTTIIAYGRADNLMYISAYATQNPINLQSQKRNEGIGKSVSEYFKHNGRFANRLKNIITTPEAYLDYKDKVIRFNDPAERANIQEIIPTAQEFGTTNDIGLEDAYFIEFGAFIDLFLNRDVLSIVRAGLSGKNQISQLIASLRKEGDYTIFGGWNKYLRSTSVDVMIIYNPDAIAAAASKPDPITNDILATLKAGPKTGGLLDVFRVSPKRTPLEISAEGATKQSAVKAILEASPFKPDPANAGPESGICSLSKGVWLNSKTIQQCFINARTVMEGMEALLNRINAATENYWDLTLYYDDDIQAFRILDNNVRLPIRKAEDRIYEFNKNISTVDDTILGPDVLDITIQSDYPKLLFSQLAISGINNGTIASDPQRRDLDFKLDRSVSDMFVGSDAVPAVSRTAPTSPATSTLPPSAKLNQQTVGTQLSTNLKALRPIFIAEADREFFRNETNLAAGMNLRLENLIKTTLSTGFPTGGESGLETVPSGVFNFINTLYVIKNPLTSEQARIIKKQFEDLIAQERLTPQQISTVKQLMLLRAVQIIVYKKRLEINNLTQFTTGLKQALEADNNPDDRFIGVNTDAFKTVVKNIKKDAVNLIIELYRAANIDGAQEAAQEAIKQLAAEFLAD